MLRSFGKDLVIYGLSSSITKFVGFFLIPLYTRVFSPEDYGSMDIILTVFALGCIISMMQLESAVSRYYYSTENKNTRNIMMSTAMWAIIGTSVLLVLILTLFSNFLSIQLFKSTQYSTVIFIAALIIPAANLNSLFSVIIRFKKRPIHFLLFQLLQVSITVSLTVFLVYYMQVGIVGVFWGMLTGFSVSAISMGYYLREQLPFYFSSSSLKKMMRYSLPLVPAVAGGWANSYMNRFVMLGYISLTEIGLYAVALKVASVFQLIGAGFRMAWPPFFWDTYENKKNHRDIFVYLQQQISMIVLFFVILIALFSKEIIILVATKAYFPAAEIVGILSLSLALSSIIMPVTGIGPSITKKTEYNTMIYFISVVVNIGSLFILVPLIGLMGVALSLLLGSLSLVFFGWFNSERLYFVGFKKGSMFINMLITLIVVFIVIIFDFHIIIRVVMAFGFSIVFLSKYYNTIKNIFDNRRKNIQE